MMQVYSVAWIIIIWTRYNDNFFVKSPKKNIFFSDTNLKFHNIEYDDRNKIRDGL